MRACREEGLSTVAVVSKDEVDPLHARYADTTLTLQSSLALPYLDIRAVLQAAVASGADAVHPGYGFLAENAAFAEACEQAGIIFVGPPAQAIAVMGDKVAARAAATAAGVPVVPGTDGPVDAAGARAFGEQFGYPLALKAAAGGGGRGFRVAFAAAEVDDAWTGASGEAARYFANPTVYVERYLDHPRHIEIQVMADRHGNVVALGERDCSIQRRHQKLVEEAPSPAVDAELRAAMNATAERLARAVGYVGAGTLEFLVQDGAFYFLEMNTRIQVEHPVTEAVTGIDLVREQLRVAGGAPLSFRSAPQPWGHAIECRINAEDAAREFTPTPGKLSVFRPPSGFGVRVDTGFENGGVIEPRFDSLIAKLIVWGRDRDEAVSRLRRALNDFEVGGVATTLPFHRALVRNPDFIRGDYDTRFLEQSNIVDLVAPWIPEPADAAADDLLPVEVDGRTYHVRLPTGIAARGRSTPAQAPRSKLRAGKTNVKTGAELRSPIQGTVLRVAVEPGARVEAGQLICIIEAMKMENEIGAQHAGVVQDVHVTAGQAIQVGGMIALIEPAATAD